jgi:Competence protein CoiA-like family
VTAELAPPVATISIVSTSPRHSEAEQVAATGDRLQIYARDTRLPLEAPLFQLERGQATRYRPDARAGHFICPIPGCQDARYTTRAGSRRDHFAHLKLVGGAHAPETWFHYTGKQVVGEWLRARYPNARVVVDHEAVENRQVPDVLCEFPDGRRFAFEVQYASLTEQDWAARHEGYAAQGIVDVWLFGHVRRYLRQVRWDEKRSIAVPLITHLVKAGIRSYWINPNEKTVGTRRDTTDPYRRDGYLDEEFDLGHGVSIGWDELAACSIDGSQFLTGVDRKETAAAPAIEAARRRENERRERFAREDAERQERYSRLGDWITRKEERRAEEYARLIRPSIERDFPGEIADIEIELPTDRGIWLHPATWHATLFRERIRGRVGRTFTFGQMCQPFFDSTSRKGGLWDAVEAYLAHLSRRGYVRVTSSGLGAGYDIEVLADTSEGALEARGW